MANIFDDLEVGKSVFKDKQPLDHRFLPENLPHRKEQITQIAKYWIEALNNVTPSDITIYGKTGTGKTAAAKFAREQLNEAASNKNVFIKVRRLRKDLALRIFSNIPNARGWRRLSASMRILLIAEFRPRKARLNFRGQPPYQVNPRGFCLFVKKYLSRLPFLKKTAQFPFPPPENLQMILQYLSSPA